MPSPFVFIPRSVAKGGDHKSSNSHIRTGHTAHLPSQGQSGGSTTHILPNAVQSEKNTLLADDDLLILIEIVLSDYSFWCNPELQRVMKMGQDGYLPLKDLLMESSVLSVLHPRPAEADIMRCIRASPESCLETRMLISEPSPSAWLNHEPRGSHSNKLRGGFEVRRKDYETLLQDLTDGRWTKEWWDQRTIYIERLPAAYRSINAIARYVRSLLLAQVEKPSTSSFSTTIQFINFPSHHLALPNEASRCKGFAFIILDSPSLIDTLCRAYPWEGSTIVPGADAEASKFGMRVLPKTTWDKLKVEYLAHQQRLLSRVAEEAATSQVDVENEWDEPLSSIPDHEDNASDPSSPRVESRTPRSWYPQNCLVFVRNIHPETNKTTLRTLFSGSLTSKDAVDYVDFHKGIDTCHLRLASPSEAAKLVAHLNTHPTSQNDALDQVGSTPTKERPKIESEVVQGKREELYWDKVPEKVRNTAVTRLRGIMDVQDVVEDEHVKRSKRRKKR